MLPKRCVEVGWETLQDEFRKFMERARTSKDHDTIFDNLKACVVDEAMRRHIWEDKASCRRRIRQFFIYIILLSIIVHVLKGMSCNVMRRNKLLC